MKLSLIVRGHHPATDDIRDRLHDDLELVRRAEEVGFDGIVKGSHYSTHPFQSVQQIPFLAYAAAIPFFRNSLLGDFTYAAILFGSWALAESRFPVLRPGPAPAAS